MAALKVLLVDDEEDLLKVLGSRIKTWGYELLQAENAKKAIRVVKDNRPDIVILDYMLPDMDGVTALREIRVFDKKIPVIMFTAYPSAKAMEGAEKLGVSAFIPKLSAYTDIQSSLKAALEMIDKNIKKEQGKNT